MNKYLWTNHNAKRGEVKYAFPLFCVVKEPGRPNEWSSRTGNQNTIEFLWYAERVRGFGLGRYMAHEMCCKTLSHPLSVSQGFWHKVRYTVSDDLLQNKTKCCGGPEARASCEAIHTAFCFHCRKQHDWRQKDENMTCISPLSVLMLNEYEIDPTYRQNLYQKCMLYNTAEILSSFLGHNPHFPSQEQWIQHSVPV